MFESTTSTRLKNQRVEIYQENGNTYLCIKGDTIVNDGESKVTVELHKIDINNIKIDTGTVYGYEMGHMYPPTKCQKNCSITFPLLFNEKMEYLTVKFDEKRIRMTKEQIEKELGYKIDIV